MGPDSWFLLGWASVSPPCGGGSAPHATQEAVLNGKKRTYVNNEHRMK
jgi:hypothetical protein